MLEHRHRTFTIVAPYIALAIPALYGAALLARNWDAILLSCEHLTDYILLSLSIENAKNFQAFTGAYSRLEFRHPGPILFYLYAVGDWLFNFLPMPLGRFRLTQFILNIGVLSLIGVGASKLFRSATIGLGTALLALLLCQGSEGTPFRVLAEIWNPYPAILPMGCLLICGALTAAGQSRFWVPMTLAFIVTSHTHLGAVPVAVFVFLGAAVSWYRMQDRTASRLSLALSGVLLGITTLPPVIDAVVIPKLGNLGAIFHFVSSSKINQPLSVVLEAVGQHYVKPFGITDPRIITLAPLILLILCWLPGLHRAEERALRWLSSAAFFISVYSLLKTTGELFPYLRLYHFGIALVILTLVFVRTCRWLDFLGQKTQNILRAERALPLLATSVLLVSLLLQLQPQTPYSRKCPTLGPARVLARGLPKRKGELNLLHTHNDRLWHSMAALGLVLARSGRAFCVQSQFWYIFESSRVCPPAAQGREVTIYESLRMAPPEGMRSVKSGPVGIYWRGKSPKKKHRVDPALQQRIQHTRTVRKKRMRSR